MPTVESLKFGHYYHIYNHRVGQRNLFYEPDNYQYFLDLYDKYISQVARIFAWVLLKNHFHLLVKIKDEAEVATAFATPDEGFEAEQENKQ